MEHFEFFSVISAEFECSNGEVFDVYGVSGFGIEDNILTVKSSWLRSEMPFPLHQRQPHIDGTFRAVIPSKNGDGRPIESTFEAPFRGLELRMLPPSFSTGAKFEWITRIEYLKLVNTKYLEPSTPSTGPHIHFEKLPYRVTYDEGKYWTR